MTASTPTDVKGDRFGDGSDKQPRTLRALSAIRSQKTSRCLKQKKLFQQTRSVFSNESIMSQLIIVT